MLVRVSVSSSVILDYTDAVDISNITTLHITITTFANVVDGTSEIITNTQVLKT